MRKVISALLLLFLLADLPAALAAVPEVSSLEARVQSLETQKGPEHAETLAVMDELAQAYRAAGRYEDAIRVLQAVLVRSRSILGEKHPDSLTSMENLAGAYSAAGRLREAEALEEEVLLLRREVLGETHPATLVSMNNLSIYYSATGRRAEALAFRQQVLEIRRKTLGDEDPATLLSMNNLASAYYEAGRLAEALKLGEQTLQLRQKILGPEQPATLISMANLAVFYSKAGHIREALSMEEAVLAIRQRTLRPGHPDILNSMNNLAVSYSEAGQIQEALRLREQVLKLEREELGETHPVTLRGMHNLAVSYNEVGRTQDAIRLKEEVLNLQKNLLGQTHPDTLSSMNNLANSYSQAGRIHEALALKEQCLKLRWDVLGQTHPDTLESMNNLAVAYQEEGRIREAFDLDVEALALMRKSLGESHPTSLSCMSNLAIVCEQLGLGQEALAFKEQVLQLRRATLGETHPDTLSSMNNLAASYYQAGRLQEALALNERGLVIRQSLLGKMHPDTLSSMSNLAVLYAAAGRNREALALEQQVLVQRRSVLAPLHPETLKSERNLALSYWQADRKNEAVSLLGQAVDGVEQRRREGAAEPGTFRQNYFSQYASWYKRLAVWQAKQKQPAKAFDTVEQAKARSLLEAAAARLADQSGILSPAETDRLQECQSRLAAYEDRMAKARSEGRQEVYLNLAAEHSGVWGEYQTLRASLMEKYSKYKQLNRPELVKATDGARLLAPDTIFISYFTDGEELWTLLLAANRPVSAVHLGTVPGLAAGLEQYWELLRYKSTDEAAASGRYIWRRANGSYLITADRESGPADGRLVNTPAKLVRSQAELGEYWGRILLAPLTRELEGYAHWLISPDENLTFLPFETLLLNGQAVILTHDISYVQSLSMLSLLQARDKNHPAGQRDLLAVGAPLYNGAPGNGGRRSAPLLMNGEHDLAADNLPGVQNLLAQLKDIWPPIPYSQREIDSVAGLFAPERVQVLSGAQASEAQLQALNRDGELSRYRYILLSAHGLLSSDMPALSAIVLSQRDNPPGTDGYITVAEWPGYDLGSRLIFLSACETGLGKLIRGEGVLGLPFALYIAGNQDTVQTLWPVWDESTAKFATRFFAKIKAGENPVRAINAVKREFIHEGGYALPVYWAPFVLYGL